MKAGINMALLLKNNRGELRRMRFERRREKRLGQKLYWSEPEARAANDVASKQCLHGLPVNVFCDKCEMA